MLRHTKERKNAETILWFILALIPVLNLYIVWRLVKLIAQHEENNGGNYEV